jgi:hypothetical protein
VVAPRAPIRIAGLVYHTWSVRKFSYVPFGAGTRMGTGEPVPRAATGSAFPHLPPGRLALQPWDRVVTRLWSGRCTSAWARNSSGTAVSLPALGPQGPETCRTGTSLTFMFLRKSLPVGMPTFDHTNHGTVI